MIPIIAKLKKNIHCSKFVKQPELAAEVTMMPVKKLGCRCSHFIFGYYESCCFLGIDFDIVKNIGPVIHTPDSNCARCERLRPIDVEKDLSHVIQTIRILDKDLRFRLITFAGAPFTIASYLIEGSHPKAISVRSSYDVR